MPTGSGKTRVLAEVARARLFEGRVLLLVHRIELAEQAHRTFKEVCEVPVGFIGAGRREDLDARVVVGLIGSLISSELLNRLQSAGSFSNLFVDEAHHCTPGGSYDRLIHALNPRVVLGCTATPFRIGPDRFQDLLTTCLFDRSMEDLAEAGVLTRLRHKSLNVRLDLRKVRTRRGEYNSADLGPAMCGEVVEAVVRLSAKHLIGRRTIVYAVDREHARELRDEYERVGFPSYFVHGDTSTRERASLLAAWRATPGAILVNVDIASEGFDEKTVEAIVMAAPTQSPGRYIQRIGRGTRKSPGKSGCIILDVASGAEARDDRQVLFDSVFLPNSGGSGAPFEGPKGRSLLSSPHKDPRNAWVVIRKDLFALAVGEGSFWVVERDPNGSGLWSAFLFEGAREPTEVERHEGLPCAEILERVHRSMRAAGPNELTVRGAPWRDEPGTEPAFRYLAILNRRAAAIARAEGWTKGELTAHITMLTALRALGRRYA